LFDPVRKSLQDAELIYLAPDGDLALFPFEILPDAVDSFLIDAFRFRYLASGRDVVQLQRTSDRKHTPSAALVMADPDYGCRSAV
jgi:hypothetical protein